MVRHTAMDANFDALSPLAVAHLDQIETDARQLLAAQTELWASVAAARDEGISWTLIGRSLGVTRQAAQERFSKPPAGRLL